MISVSVSVICAPICRNPRRCCSTRRAPMSSPPGRGRRARPNRPSRAPSRRMVALMRRPSSAGTSLASALAMFRDTVPSPAAEPPRPVRISAITYVSRTLGTLVNVTVSFVRRAAAISGRAAFFEPLMQMLPASCAPPVIRSARCSRSPTLRSLAPAHPSEPEAGFSDGEGVLELGLFGGGERAGQLFLGAAARFLSAFDRDLAGLLGDVREHCYAVGQHLEESTAHEQDLLRPSVHLLNPQRPRLQDRHERGVAREHAEFSIRAIGDDELDVPFEQGSLNADHPERKFQPISLPPQGEGGPSRSDRSDGGRWNSDSSGQKNLHLGRRPLLH